MSSFNPIPWVILVCITAGSIVRAQPYGEPDTGAPGDAMIQRYLASETAGVGQRWAPDAASRETWEARRPQYYKEYLYMLGLSPLPERTPLHATVTGSIERDDCTIDLIHYQSRPGLYVTGNLYRPSRTRPGERLPAVLYVCGHSHRGRNGNKVAYQSHGLWFARHGYVCLVIDTLQLGEIAAVHHGTYNLQRWWWHSRGYTPAGVEAWNGIRGIDYLISRDDVDPQRIAVTGISGGGAATFWIAAADDRVSVAVPVSGMADLESYVPNRVINGHCDCMFLYNTFQWPWTRIAALIAPRPLLFVNSDADPIFPMDANERVIARLERLYSLFGAGDRVDAVVSVGGHAYRADIRKAAYRFINTWLKRDPRPVDDSERDIVSEGSRPGPYPIPPESLRVFPTDADIPSDQINTTVDERFVPVATPPEPEPGGHARWKEKLLGELKRVTFPWMSEPVPPARELREIDARTLRMESEDGIEFELRLPEADQPARDAVLLAVLNSGESGTTPEWVRTFSDSHFVVLCEPRGIGATRWTTKNPPNYVERSHALIGRTVDGGRVWDVISAFGYLKESRRVPPGEGSRPIRVAGREAAGVIAAYAALLSDAVAEVILVDPPTTHQSSAAPQLLNCLRVCDIPDVLGMLAPRPLTLVAPNAATEFKRTLAAYSAAGARDRVSLQ